MESTLKLRIIDQYASTTSDAVASCASVHKIADKLTEKGFISPELRSDILDNASLRERSRRLVDAVRTQVKLNPSQFEVFIGILEEQPSLKSLAAQLKQDCGKQWLTP